MICQDYKEMMMGYLDNELPEEQKRTFEEHLATCRQCADELKEFRKLKQITEAVTLAEPEERIWQQYWASIYNRIERTLGWILLSVAGIGLAGYGGFKAIEDIIRDPAVGVILKVALLALIAGVAILFVSVLRERLYFWGKDRYRHIRR